MDDVNNMDESMDGVEQAPDGAAKVLSAGVDRRTMLKAAVVAGAFAGAWVAPRIETLGFAPAAAMTLCMVTNNPKDDLNSNSSSNTYVSTGHIRCGKSFGNSGGNQDTITFSNPTANCNSITVGTIPLDCPPNNGSGDVVDPDESGFAVVLVSSQDAPGHTGACANCKIAQATINTSSGGNNRGPAVAGIGNPFTTPYMTSCGTGVRVEPTGLTAGCPQIPSDARLAVTLACTGVVRCTP